MMEYDQLTMEIFCKLMEQDTVNPPGNEMRGAMYLKEVFDRENIPCEIQDLGNNRANFIAQIGSGKPVLEFGGHLDVVPCVGEWHYEKIGATEEGPLLYGRGACDMKSGVAAACATVISLHREKVPLHGTIRLTFVADEEYANLGMHAFLKNHSSADFTVLGEPTLLHTAVAHRGVARFYIDLHGRACHAALRNQEMTAVSCAARAIMAIEKMNQELLSISHPVLPSPSVVVTQVEGYEKDNVVPGKVRLLTDFRILPGMTEEMARGLLIRALDEAGITHYTLEKRFFMLGGEVPTSHPFVNRCCEIVSSVRGSEEKPCAFDASCEQCFLVEAGSVAVILGPGSLEQAHTVDEFVEKQQLLDATRIYRKIALGVLG